MSIRYDLHCHSHVSDGALSPHDLVQRAFEKGVTHLALTDHDTIDGLAMAKTHAETVGITLINGIELSTSWHSHCIHILGLGINPHHLGLSELINRIQAVRVERSFKIAEKLAKKQITGALEAVKLKAGDGMITRIHFADYLVSQGYVKTQQDAFDRYLGKGKSAYVSTTWAEFNEAIHIICDAGGIPVLAHPLRYKLTASWLNRLLTDFKQAGGKGIEVITGRSNTQEIQTVANYAKTFNLLASAGSDFHAPDMWVELGRLSPLPNNTVQAVWEMF